MSADVSKLQLSLLSDANERIRILEKELRVLQNSRDEAIADAQALRAELCSARELLEVLGLSPHEVLSDCSASTMQRLKRQHAEQTELNRRREVESIRLWQQVEELQHECEMRRLALLNSRNANPVYAQAFQENNQLLCGQGDAAANSGCTAQQPAPNTTRDTETSNDAQKSMSSPKTLEATEQTSCRRRSLERYRSIGELDPVPSHYYSSFVRLCAQELNEQLNSEAGRDLNPTLAMAQNDFQTRGELSGQSALYHKQIARHKTVAFRVSVNPPR